jgi:DNA mismatch repair protein MutS2
MNSGYNAGTMRAAERYANLEFDRLLHQLANYAGSELTRQLIHEIEVVFHPARIEENLDQTAEAVRFMEEKPSVILPYFSQLTDLVPLWEHMSAGALVDNAEARQCIRFFEVCAQFDGLGRHLTLAEFPRLSDSASAWQTMSALAAKTRNVFSEDGDVRDNASPELARIREKLRRFESQVRHSLSSLFKDLRQYVEDDPVLAIRGGRFVVLMPRHVAGHYQGSIVDLSGTGQSVYFEPNQLAPMNAERQGLFLEEGQEVRRVLRDYSMAIAGQLTNLKANLAILVKLDYVFARARHACATKAQRPQMNNAGRLRLVNAVHPLLFKDFVSETLIFEQEKALIVSGVNAGGKTVLLKLMGLYSLMAALGCFVPGAVELPYLSGIYADIGDDQSTLANLSTFTAHLRFVAELWDVLRELEYGALPVLVLIDEIGTGTEPGEGAAFAFGLITRLLDYPVKVGVTTHYDLLKTIAFERPEVKNVSLEFDREALRPTFRILDDQPGQSFALEIATRWGIDTGVLGTAHSVLGQEEVKMASVIGALEEAKLEAEDTRKAIRQQALELERIKRENEQLTAELKEAKQKFAKHAEQVKQDLTRKVDDLLTETKQKLKKKAQQSTRKHDEYVKAASKTAQVARQQKDEVDTVVGAVLAELEIDPLEAKPRPGVRVETGMQVIVEGSRVRGKVLELDARKNKAVLEVHGRRMTVDLDKLLALSAQAAKPLDPLASYRSGQGLDRLDFRMTAAAPLDADTLDLHGQTIQEAFESLEEFISSAILANLLTVRIMHGIGTGRLRTFVQDYLRRNQHLTNVRPASVHDGGGGVTLADLK